MNKTLIALLALGSALALSLLADPNNKTSRDLTGSWRIRVVIPPGNSACPPGPDPCVFLALASCSSDGTAVQTAALPATSTGHGVWKRSGRKEFSTRTTYFRFNEQGIAVGTSETVSMLELSDDGRIASGVYVNTVLDLAGNVVTSFNATVTGSRIEL